MADAALYGAENLASLGELRWLCRVPRTLKEARRVLAETPREAFVRSAAHEGYRFAEAKSEHGGVKQRWLVVHSEELEKAARQRLERRLLLRERELEGELKRLLLARKVSFACRADAEEAVETFAAEHLRGKKGYHRLAAASPPFEIVEEARYAKPGAARRRDRARRDPLPRRPGRSRTGRVGHRGRAGAFGALHPGHQRLGPRGANRR